MDIEYTLANLIMPLILKKPLNTGLPMKNSSMKNAYIIIRVNKSRK